ncbi:enoyl-CoA hydratase-related protein [Roseivivax sp. GX 12232]|uniref:enoyl-CoA hydratase/isomerase family protein n=1 Tax=Roseivivax sp. GX 12232 TaxID=2900547 RepID=UPI001E53559D|nr:enoyl-CoA hydratase-related protein [Roseivivax sp. GX 12232]MCE0506173.1 enoyl-CoA hydratase-related protein [Roseivivax sp. GX 12232]
MSELVTVTIEGAVAELRFNRPEALNALDLPLARAFAEAVDRVTADPAVRAILLCGAGRAFVAGGDVAAMAADPDRGHEVVDALLEVLNPAVLALRAGDAPVIAAVRGVAAGAGLSLVANADLVVADAEARFVMAYDQVAGVPDCGGTWFLTHRIGRAKVLEMMLTGAPMTGAEAQAAGLVTRLCPEDQVEGEARKLASRVARGPTQSYGRFRRLIDAAPHHTLVEQLAAERSEIVAAAHSADFREGVSAFTERRKPEFRGQ